MRIPEIEVKVRFKDEVKASELFTIKGSKDAAKAFQTIFDADTIQWREEFMLLTLDRANHVTGYFKISSGGTAGTVVDVKMLYMIALRACAASIIIGHNHPSGQLVPSDADLKITRKIKDAGKLLDIECLDHLIITRESYMSFADEGYI